MKCQICSKLMFSRIKCNICNNIFCSSCCLETHIFIEHKSLVKNKIYEKPKIERIIKEKHDEAFPMILVGNKQDLTNNREVSYDEAKQLADSWNIEYIETSAKTNFNCDEAFKHLSVKIYEYKSRQKRKRSSCPCSIY